MRMFLSSHGKGILNGKGFLSRKSWPQLHHIQNNSHVYLDAKKLQDKASLNKIKFIMTTFSFKIVYVLGN